MVSHGCAQSARPRLAKSMNNQHFGGTCRLIEQGGCQVAGELGGERNPGTDRTASEFPAKGDGNPWQSCQSPGAVSYSSNMLRRTFLQTLPAAAAAITAASAEEVPVKLGFDTYSVRAFKWKGTQLL